jgi:hypothetical protein
MKVFYKTGLYILLAMLIVISGFFLVPKYVYGPSYPYQSEPPGNEGWIKVSSISMDSSVLLENGEEISLSPFRFVEDAKLTSEEGTSQQLFGVSVDNLYLRKEENGFWKVRLGNFLICALPHWFPKEYYGYFEANLVGNLAMLRTQYSSDHPLIEVVDQKALDDILRSSESLSN